MSAAPGRERGFLCLVLHAHLPFVRHPEHEDFLEEDWLYEAITETYLPLLQLFDSLQRDGVPFRITLSLTPTLCAMLGDDLLRARYRKRLGRLQDLAARQARSAPPEFQPAARMYEERLAGCRDTFDARYGGDLLSAFRRFQDAGVLEIITCGATHGFFPLMLNRASVRAQVRVAVEDYRERFGRPPRGMWLPECAYRPGDDAELKAAGLRYFFLDAHGLVFAHPRPRDGVFSPVYCPTGVAAFARDLESGHQVWSADVGYPGDFRYREFYRDLGYDLPQEEVRPYLHADGVRRNVGLKYHRITGKVPLHEKAPYDPAAAREAAAEHAGNFMFNRQHQARHLRGVLGRPPVIVSTYDAELFGHWWYEGPEFLNFLFRKIAYDQEDLRLVTPSEYLDGHPRLQVAQPAASSWGDKGYYEVWLNGSNDWIYPHLHRAADRMEALAREHPHADGLLRRALNQAARELLLAQASDWAFIMTAGTMTAYAERRTRDHVNRFLALDEQIRRGEVREAELAEMERRDNLFPNLDYRVYGV